MSEKITDRIPPSDQLAAAMLDSKKSRSPETCIFCDHKALPGRIICYVHAAQYMLEKITRVQA